eukprot:gene21529-24416_t
MNRPLYAQRLNRDVSELFSNNFNCSSSTLTVLQTSDSLQAEGCLVLRVSIFEGPYRRGTYAFGLNIPENYPFRPVEIFAKQPIWHPNIDLFTGKVALPIEWSPVLTLNSIAVAVQMLMLEPSPENPLNMEAYSYFLSQSDTFDQLVQKSISGGCGISGVKFESVLTPTSHDFGYPTSASMIRMAQSPSGRIRSSDRAGAMSPISNHVFTQRLGKQGSNNSVSQMEDTSTEDITSSFGSTQGYQPLAYNSNFNASMIDAPRSVSADSNSSSSSSLFGGQMTPQMSHTHSQVYSSQPPLQQPLQAQQLQYNQTLSADTSRAQILAPHRSQQGKKRSFEEADNEVCGPLEPMRNPFHVFPLHLNRSNSSASSGYSNNSNGTTPRVNVPHHSMTAPAIPGLSRVSSAEDWNNHIARLSLNPTYHNSNTNTGYTLASMGSGNTQQYVPSMQHNNINYGPGQSVHSIHSNIPSVNSELDKLHAQNLSDGNLSTMVVDMSSPYKRGRASTALSNRSISVSTNMMDDFGL